MITSVRQLPGHYLKIIICYILFYIGTIAANLMLLINYFVDYLPWSMLVLTYKAKCLL